MGLWLIGVPSTCVRQDEVRRALADHDGMLCARVSQPSVPSISADIRPARVMPLRISGKLLLCDRCLAIAL